MYTTTIQTPFVACSIHFRFIVALIVTIYEPCGPTNVSRSRVADLKDPTRDEVYAAGRAESPPVDCECACYAMIADRDLFSNIRSIEEATNLNNDESVVEVVPGRNGSGHWRVPC